MSYMYGVHRGVQKLNEPNNIVTEAPDLSQTADGKW